MNDNLFIQSLKILFQDASDQEKYIHNLFKDEKYDNAEKLLLEFEDSESLIEKYLKNRDIKTLFFELKKVIDEIDRRQLFYTYHLKDDFGKKYVLEAENF